ncbi:MAG TPA: TIGR02266 family protein [Kofleriaceae bacterium]
MADPNTRQGKRTPVTLKIKFKSETLEQFIERYAVDVSQGGIFIRTKEPLAVGTQMKFEFQLRDASPLIAGEGTVVWTRENDPSRPAIAPGMGVRFDRLADGSQGILERILTEKAKQAPQRPAADTAKPPMFTDTPTRVAPAPMQEALLGKGDSGRIRRGDDGHSDSHTPLPKPMPFHSDADEFPDEAFEEATKVRALDELIAQTAEGGSSEDTPGRRGRGDVTGSGPIPARHEHRSEPRHEPRHEHRSEPRHELRGPVEAEVPDLPNPPDPARPPPRLLDTSPSPRIESPPALPEAMAKTRLGVEPARARVSSSTPPPPIPAFGPSLSELPPLPSGLRAVAAEQTEPARMPPLRSRSIAPLLILIFVVVAAGGAAVWFLVLRPQQIAEPRPVAPPGPGSAVAVPAPGSAHPGSAAPAGSNTGAPASGNATGSAALAGSNAPAAELVETQIAANVDGATVEITGTDQSGPAPLNAKLEKAKPYKARITARGYAALEIDLKGGDAKQTAKLVPKPRVISVASDPPGAQISVDGTPTGHVTPFEVELSSAQSGKKSVRVVLRKAGFRPVDRTIELAKMAEDDIRMTAKLDEKLATAPVVVPSRAGSSGGSAKPPGPGSDAGSGAGSDTSPSGNGPGSGDGSAATPPVTPAPGGGSSAGSATEPEPEFTKPK